MIFDNFAHFLGILKNRWLGYKMQIDLWWLGYTTAVLMAQGVAQYLGFITFGGLLVYLYYKLDSVLRRWYAPNPLACPVVDRQGQNVARAVAQCVDEWMNDPSRKLGDVWINPNFQAGNNRQNKHHPRMARRSGMRRPNLTQRRNPVKNSLENAIPVADIPKQKLRIPEQQTFDPLNDFACVFDCPDCVQINGMNNVSMKFPHTNAAKPHHPDNLNNMVCVNQEGFGNPGIVAQNNTTPTQRVLSPAENMREEFIKHVKQEEKLTGDLELWSSHFDKVDMQTKIYNAELSKAFAKWVAEIVTVGKCGPRPFVFDNVEYIPCSKSEAVLVVGDLAIRPRDMVTVPEQVKVGPFTPNYPSGQPISVGIQNLPL